MSKPLTDCKFKNCCIDSKEELEKKPGFSEGKGKMEGYIKRDWRVDGNFRKDGERV